MTVAPTPVESPHEHHRYRWLLVVVLVLVAAAVAVGLLFQFGVFGGSSTSITSAAEGSGTAATQARAVAPFQSIELAGSNNLVVRVGEKQSVVVSADDNLINRVTTQVQQGTLVIRQKQRNFTTKSPMRVVVSVPMLNALTLSGSGKVAVSGIKAESLTVLLSGSGKLTGSGTATTFDASIAGSGSGSILFGRLIASNVRANVGGSGSIFVTATKSLDASVSGSGAIVYAGNPRDVTKKLSGMGSITAKP